jgi:protein-S-isoprenylcysteine O-methyltransferase Ste14
MLIFSFLMLGVSRLLPKHDLLGSGQIPVSIIFVLIGSLFALLGVLSFRKARTTVNPMLKQESSSLVTSGIYTITRNPMYVGFLFVLIGFGLILSSAFALIFCVGFVLYMNRFQIEPEEIFLASSFPVDYPSYKAKVRRWL